MGVRLHEVVGDAFPGGPVDTILLRLYADHVARHLWDGEVSLFGSLIMYTFVRKMFMMLFFLFRIEVNLNLFLMDGSYQSLETQHLRYIRLLLVLV